MSALSHGRKSDPLLDLGFLAQAVELELIEPADADLRVIDLGL